MDRRRFIQLAGKAGFVLLLLRRPESLFALPPDNAAYKKQLELIQRIREMADMLGMNIGNDFYSKWNEEKNSFYYCLYVSMPDKINMPTFDENGQLITNNEMGVICSSYNDALSYLIELQKKYEVRGSHTMLYKTAGVANTRLNTILLNYPLETISFIAFHEATHRHIRSWANYMPYIFEEACADVIGTHATIELAKQYPNYFSLQTAKNQLECMEEIDNCIISATKKYENKDFESPEKLYTNCHDEILKHFPKNNQFFIDRYDYAINNAYFLRYKNYTHYYFLLNKALHKMGLNEFIPFINLLPTDEQHVKELLEIVCR